MLKTKSRDVQNEKKNGCKKQVSDIDKITILVLNTNVVDLCDGGAGDPADEEDRTWSLSKRFFS